MAESSVDTKPKTVIGVSSPKQSALSLEGQPISPQSPVLPLAPESQRPSLLRRLLQGALWGSVFVGTAAMSAVAGAVVALTLPLPSFSDDPQPEPASIVDLWRSGFRYQVSRPVNILVMGTDAVPGASETSPAAFSGRTDTLLLVRVNPEAGTINVLSIPRDTRVNIPGYGMDKINQANVEGGPELVAQTVGYNLGNVTIDRYVRVSTNAFKELVDLVGGVEVMVPKRMEYTDRTQGLYIDLYPGWQLLDGDQAEQFARFRRDANGDIGRVQRQQILLKAFRDRLTNPTVIPKLPQAVRVVQRHVDTNLSLEEMLALANFGLELESSDLQMVMLPGRFSGSTEYTASYWLPDWDRSAPIIQDFFQTDTLALLADNDTRYISDLNIAVQNASGAPDVGSAVARYLRENGFTGVYVVADWPAPMQHTQVVAQQGDIESASVVGSVLGLGDVVAESTGDLRSDITIRVGEDWVERFNSQANPVRE